MHEANHKCGVAGVYSEHEHVVPMTVTLLHHQNHRGQEGAGIAAFNEDGVVRFHRGDGWAKNAFTPEIVSYLSEHDPHMAVGHDRYSVSGGPEARQPFVRNGIAFAHNGNSTNARDMLSLLPPDGQSDIGSDTDIQSRRLTSLVTEHHGDILSACSQLARESEGANNWIIAGGGMLIGMRDPWGFHPLSIGISNEADEAVQETYVLASETSAYISPLQMRYLRDVEPGEGVVIDQSGLRTFYNDERAGTMPKAQCVFELIYFASPDAYIFDRHVGTIRNELGRSLARRDIKDGYDPGIIVPVQQSGIVHAVGYAQEYIEHYARNREKYDLSDDDFAEKLSSLHIQFGLIRNPYSGRAFIDAYDKRLANSGKHRSDEHIVSGKNITVIDDSIVKGNAQETVMRLLKNANASNVHVRIASPPIEHECFWGIDFADRRKLVAAGSNGHDVETYVAREIGAERVHYIDQVELLRIVMGDERFSGLLQQQTDDILSKAAEIGWADYDAGDLYEESDWCGACFHGRRPTDISGVFEKDDKAFTLQPISL